MPDEDFSIQASALNHWFGAGEARKQALFDIDLRRRRGSFIVMVGPSGTGKTTLLTLLGCLREIQDGSVLLLGKELRNAMSAQNVRLRRRLGFIFQAHNLHESLTARQNVPMRLVFALFGLYVFQGGAFEMRTVGAMSLRLVVWLAIAVLAARHISSRKADDREDDSPP